MRGLGTLINTFAVIAGGLLGMCLKNGMKQSMQDILMQAGEAASKFCREKSESMEKEILDKLKANGATITEVTDNAPWAEACKTVIEENTKDQADLYQQLLDFAN